MIVLPKLLLALFCLLRQPAPVEPIAPAIGLGLTWVIGEGLAITGGLGLGGFLLGKTIYDSTQQKNHDHHFPRHENGDEKPYYKADKAPGKPTEKDGWKPPKNWDGEKVRNPNGSGSGWPAKDGGVWVPTGEGTAAHGGEHWDVEYPDGSYDNVYPGGKKRGGNRK